MADRKVVFMNHEKGVEAFLKNRGDTPQVRGLFLGTGESGKSTIFKQMRLVYGRSFDANEREQYAKVIWAVILKSMRKIVDQLAEVDSAADYVSDYELSQCVRLIQSLDLTDKAIMSSDRAQDLQRFFLEKEGQVRIKGPKPVLQRELDNIFSADAGPGHKSMIPLYENSAGFMPDRQIVAHAIHTLWKGSKTIQAFVASGRADIEHNMPLFFDKVLEFSNPERSPTDDDILNARIKTTGLISDIFMIRNSPFQVVDVGGQRTERKKWIHCFDDATCIFYVVSLADYAVQRYTDSSNPVNSLEESLQVYKDIMSNPVMRKKPVALFLNKMDVLGRQLKLFPFNEYQKDYRGDPQSVDEVASYVEQLFRNAVNVPASSVYTYRTCATDRYAMQFIVEAVTNMIFIENLKWAGMM